MPQDEVNKAALQADPATLAKDDPFGGLTGGVKADTIVPGKTKNYALAIVGRQKSGKSFFATSDNETKKVWVADFDNRSESVSGKKNVYIKTFIDINQQSPQAIKNLEIDLELFKYRKVKGQPIPDVFVLDSITYMKKVL
ncbi:MAG TPA: AAA family ATPase, partial [Candidatus Saccharimonadales bacterium]